MPEDFNLMQVTNAELNAQQCIIYLFEWERVAVSLFPKIYYTWSIFLKSQKLV